MEYACESSAVPVKEADILFYKPVPVPLLQNLGGANLLSYAIDVVVSTSILSSKI